MLIAINVPIRRINSSGDGIRHTPQLDVIPAVFCGVRTKIMSEITKSSGEFCCPGITINNFMEK